MLVRNDMKYMKFQMEILKQISHYVFILVISSGRRVHQQTHCIDELVKPIANIFQ